jgi:Myb-like DNA-binding protein RAP1
MSYQDLGFAYQQPIGRGPIFKNMAFFIPMNELRRDEIAKLIVNNGGAVQATHSEGVFVLSTLPQPMLDLYKMSFIDDCLEQGIQLDISLYRHPNYHIQQADHQLSQYASLQYLLQQQQQPQQQQAQQYQYPGQPLYYNQPLPQQQVNLQQQQQQLQHLLQTQQYGNAVAIEDKRNGNAKHSFTPEEDEIILERVRQDPRRRTSHKLFDEIAQVLTNHTGNSIRYRYRNQLERKLTYVYKTDENGALVKHGDSFVRESIHNIPKTMKNKFTAEDDLRLCQSIIDFNVREHQKQVADGVKDEKRFPLNLEGSLTVPVSFFRDMERTSPNHSRAAWRDRYRKFATKYGIKKYVDYCAVTPKSEWEPMKDFTKRGHIKAILPDVADLKSLMSSATNGLPQTQQQQANSDLHKKEPILQALDEEIGETKSSKIDESLLNMDKSGDVIAAKAIVSQGEEEDDPDLFVDAADVLKNTDSLAESQSTNMGEESQEMAFTYPNPKMRHQDLFTDTFYKFNTIEELELVLNEIVVGQSDIAQIFSLFESKLGFTQMLSTVIILYTCGDIKKICEYVTEISTRMIHPPENVKSEDIYKILEVDGVNGIWNQTYDKMLTEAGKSNMDRLRQVHDEEHIEARQNFLGHARRDEQIDVV